MFTFGDFMVYEYCISMILKYIRITIDKILQKVKCYFQKMHLKWVIRFNTIE